jgi:hypothetical protein
MAVQQIVAAFDLDYRLINRRQLRRRVLVFASRRHHPPPARFEIGGQLDVFAVQYDSLVTETINILRDPPPPTETARVCSPRLTATLTGPVERCFCRPSCYGG